MIHSLCGTLVQIRTHDVLLAVGPITLSLHVPINALGPLSHAQGLITLFTSLIWRDTGPQLFGFLKAEQIDLFEKLQTASGVGPKLALSIMGHYESHELAQHLQSGDVAALNRIPGIGQKTAQRLIVELKDKASQWNFSSQVTGQHPYAEDALKALVNLGYNAAQARRMIETATQSDKAIDLGSLITLALQKAST